MARARNGAILIARESKGAWVMDSISGWVIKDIALGLGIGFTLGYGICWLQTWWLSTSGASTKRDTD
jgi:hypothetical protein